MTQSASCFGVGQVPFEFLSVAVQQHTAHCLASLASSMASLMHYSTRAALKRTQFKEMGTSSHTRLRFV